MKTYFSNDHFMLRSNELKTLIVKLERVLATLSSFLAKNTFRKQT